MKKILCFLFLFFPFIGFAGEASHYKKMLKKYTRHGEDFNIQTMAANLVIDGLYLSDEFREAYAKRFAEIYRLNSNDTRLKVNEEIEKSKKGTQFLLSVFTYDKKWNELETDQSIWKLRLEFEGKSYTPLQVEKLKITPADTTFYPFLTPWSKLYLVTFDKNISLSDQSSFEMALFGVKGNRTLVWK
ncbi:MAG: hypothetical protein JNK65_09165 [Deltaproteobacteria bacterium]|nr:hypothetical protein [Deltaproteobacteria bacterium]